MEKNMGINDFRLCALRHKIVNEPKNIDWSLVESLQEQDSTVECLAPGVLTIAGGMLSSAVGKYMVINGIADLSIPLINTGAEFVKYGSYVFIAGCAFAVIGAVASAVKDFTVEARRRNKMASLLTDYLDGENKKDLLLTKTLFDEVDLCDMPDESLVAIVCNLASHRNDEYDKALQSLADLTTTIHDRNLGTEEFYSSSFIQRLDEVGTVIPEKPKKEKGIKGLKKVHLFSS